MEENFSIEISGAGWESKRRGVEARRENKEKKEKRERSGRWQGKENSQWFQFAYLSFAFVSGEEGRREKRNFEFPNRATKYVRTRFNVNYEFELFFRTICFFDAVNFREIRVEKKKTSRGKFRCASCWKRSFERTLVTDLIISIAVSSDRPTRDENVWRFYASVVENNVSSRVARYLGWLFRGWKLIREREKRDILIYFNRVWK